MSGKQNKKDRKEQEQMNELKLLIDNGYVVLKECEIQTTYKLQEKVKEVTGRELKDIDTSEVDDIMSVIVEEIKNNEQLVRLK